MPIARRGRCSLALAILLSAGVAFADGTKDRAAQPVVVGLLPLKAQNGPGDITALADAQRLRAILESSLEKLGGHPVIGHNDLLQLDKSYLPHWFQCKSDASCIIKNVLGPVAKQGYTIAVTGDYYVADAVYHFRITSFSIVDGKVSKQIQFEIPAEAIDDPQKWLAGMAPFGGIRSGKIRIASNVGELGCTIDGKPCEYDAEHENVIAPAGDHTLVLTKDNYLPETIKVTVVIDAQQEVAVALKPVPDTHPTGKPGVIGGQRPSLTAVRVAAPPSIDGKLDDSVWQKAWRESTFTQNYPDQGKAPTQATELRVLYDDEAIYVAIRCYDNSPDEIDSRLTRRDRDVEADRITVDISSKNDRSSAYHFQVNSAGVQLDGTRFNDTNSSNDWDAVWYSATSIDGEGWTAELKIPLGALRYNGEATSFGFQVRRYIQRRKEIDEWAFVPRDAQGEVSYYGTLDGLVGLDAKRLFQLAPYDSRRVTFRSKQDNLDGTSFGGNIGADMKLGLTPALTLDATVNPDFGTVEVDQVVLNLSTVETYFPEKRPFFIEGADLFATPIQLFYSRRVGRPPPATFVDGSLAEPPPDGKILAAAKVTGLLASRLSIGLLEAVTDSAFASIQRTGSSAPEDVLVDPLANFTVARIKQDFGTNSSIGAMATGVIRNEQPNEAAPTSDDFCPRAHGGLTGAEVPVDGRCFNNAYAGGVDTVLRSGDWGVSAQAVGSVLERGPQRRVPDGTAIKPGDFGWGVQGEAGKYGGKHVLLRVPFNYLTPKLDVNDAGFLGASNDGFIAAEVKLRSTDPVFIFQDAYFLVRPAYEFFPDTRRPSERAMFFGVAATFKNFWTISSTVAPYLPYGNNRETRDGADLVNPTGMLGVVRVGTDPRKSVILNLSYNFITTARGLGSAGNVTLNLRPLSYLELDLISDGSYSYGDPRWIDRATNPDSSHTYYFADLDSRSFDVLLRGTLTFSPTLSLQMYAQLYLDSGHYSNPTGITAAGDKPILEVEKFLPAILPSGDNNDFRDSALNLNAFLRWQFRPGSALWLVYTRSQTNQPYDLMEGTPRLRFDRVNGPSTDVLLVKLSYLWEP